MKNQLTLSLLVFLSIFSWADTVLFEEDFGSVYNASYLTSSGNWDSANPNSNSSSTPCEGTRNWCPMWASATSAKTVNIAIPSTGTITLTFEMKYSKSWGTMPVVNVSVDGGAYNLLKELSYQTNCLTVSIDLSSYGGSDISLEFKSTDSGGTFQLDNILVNHSSTSCSEVYFEEDFGSAYEAGYLTNHNWCASDWDYNTSFDACEGWSWKGSGTTYDLRTNSFTLGATGDIILSFDYKYDDDQVVLSPTVDISTDGCNGTYAELLQLEKHLTCHTATITIPSTYWSETVNLCFQTYKSGATLILDNIKVQKCDAVLPVVLTNFVGKPEANRHLLEWSTASEINNNYFEIERSIDGQDFEYIGEIQGKGNSSSNINYQFIDEYPKQTINYYRLKQVDYDGLFEYSKIIAIQSINKNNYRFFISKNKQAIVEFDQTYTGFVKIFDLMGRMVCSQKLTNSCQAKFSHLNQGFYVLQIENLKLNNTQKIFIP